jgi:LPXTG-motif cell wall-anchored protein
VLQVYNPDLISSSSPDADPCEACQGTTCQQGGASTGGSSSSPTLFIAGGGGGFLLLVIVVLLLRRKKALPAYNSELGTVVDADIWEIDRRLVRLADKLGVSARACVFLWQREPCA